MCIGGILFTCWQSTTATSNRGRNAPKGDRNMNKRQKQAMARFHKLAEKAYKEHGQEKNAKQAKLQREKLEKGDKWGEL